MEKDFLDISLLVIVIILLIKEMYCLGIVIKMWKTKKANKIN